MRRLLGFLLLLILIGAAALAYLAFIPTGPRAETFLEVAPGTSTADIASDLKQKGLIRSELAFDLLHLVRGGTLKAGEYRFDHPLPMDEVYTRLGHGEVYTRSLTIPEGSNLFDIAQRIEAAQLGSKDAFLAAARRDTNLIADLDPSATSLEGYLFPDTYRFERLATPEQMVSTMVRRFRAAAAAAGLAGEFHRTVTLASLIEKETPIDAERPLVASVFENRLAKGMPLMTDPSVIYAALIDGRYRGTIYQSDLAAESPYNTYKHAGLPPGPVCNPGLASLNAAMHPAKTDYLYFVAASADPSGHSRFAATLAEHQRNVEDYRRQRARDSK